MELLEITNTRIQHGHTPIFVAGVMRLFSLFSLTIIFLSVFKTFYNKLHSINGLRPYRVAMMAILLSAIIDQSLFMYFDAKTFFSNASGVLVVEPPYLVFNSLVTFMAYSFLYFLFIHASKKDKTDL